MRLTPETKKSTPETKKSTPETKKPTPVYENEMHKLNTELQVALLKWKISSHGKKTKFDF